VLVFLWPVWVQAAWVIKVVDGDTLVVRHRGRRVRVRLMGVDTPESRSSEKLRRQARRTGISVRRIRQWGRRAARFTRRQCDGRRIGLRLDRIGDRRDRYGRMLAYVILPNGRVLNAELVRQGLALAYRRYRYGRKRKYLRLERRARDARRGLWADRAWRRFVAADARRRPRRPRRPRIRRMRW
jgi:micrococcal nuclease